MLLLGWKSPFHHGGVPAFHGSRINAEIRVREYISSSASGFQKIARDMFIKS
jgi:hypothetical protein